ncbi:hypothetical protein ACOMICROBIO_GDFFDHBD_02966 [Vibrio sp. B1REV9]|uniref:hypothetical protein n=1 Tax=Vibrio sp. B1REV9 TaxID=2751179 RepID=UPI001AFA78DD|nr:hypothetical protein [Vibrio sp. B1REV9]CAE6937105.1 hypothetical protein ACOMICROBIO_GDFFDHBD_02966 [Vibrio sp. B1REV9]
MPLPFLLVGAAAVAGLYGASKSKDAYDDTKEAKDVNARARRTFDDAEELLENAKNQANQSMITFGHTKFDVYQNTMTPFFELYSNLKNIDFSELDNRSHDLTVTESELVNVHQATLNIQSVLSGGVTALGAGGLAGLAAYGGASALATASTGTAISALSGAAATNATLAWFGGGALSTGGLGMAGGTAVLGGIVAGPVLAVGGALWASKAEAAKENAYENLAAAELASEQMYTAEVKVRAIGQHFDSTNHLLDQLNAKALALLPSLEDLIKTERVVQFEWKKSLVQELMASCTDALNKANQLEQSQQGLWCKIKYLFTENPNRQPCIDAFQSFVEHVSHPQVSELNSESLSINASLKPSAYAKEIERLLNILRTIDSELDSPSDSVSYTLLSEQNKTGCALLVSLICTISRVIHQQMLSEDGDLVPESIALLNECKPKELQAA